MRQQGANIAPRRQVARRPQSISRARRGNNSDTHQKRLVLPISHWYDGLDFLARQRTGGEQQQGKIGGKGVVLLIGG